MRLRGHNEEDAVRRTLAQAGNWQTLQRNILIAKRGGPLMGTRMRQLWAPGLLAMALSTVFLIILQKSGFQPRIASGGAIFLNVPWLATLPFFGALAACLSSRAGASQRTVLLASAFPALAFALALFLMFPIGAVVEGLTGRHVDFSSVATLLLKDGLAWIVVPGTALLAGGLLARLLFCRPAPSQVSASRT